MAKKIIHQLVDDLDGTVLEPGEGETVLFALDGKSYEVDLTESNAAALRSTLERYIAVARRTQSSIGGSASRTTQQRRRSGQTDYAPIRAWAKDNGYQISERGRIPQAIIDAYQAAH